jgi:putative glutathione S-transferase
MLTDQEKHKVKDEGAYVRPPTKFHAQIPSEEFPAENGRYHLYVSHACPWASRTLLVRTLKGLEDVISVSFTSYKMDDLNSTDYKGWHFSEEYPDHLHPSHTRLHDVYRLADPDYPNKSVSVPILFDKKKDTIVSNESAEIIRMLNSAFNEWAKNPSLDLEKHAEAEDMNDLIYPAINDGVYRCGFAREQVAYETAFHALFNAMDQLETRLATQRFLVSDTDLTMADVRLWVTLVRFDAVYHTHFKCNKKKLTEYPNLFAYTCDIYQMGNVKTIIDMEMIKKHYYECHTFINPRAIVAIGPDNLFMTPVDRSHLQKV